MEKLRITLSYLACKTKYRQDRLGFAAVTNLEMLVTQHNKVYFFFWQSVKQVRLMLQGRFSPCGDPGIQGSSILCLRHLNCGFYDHRSWGMAAWRSHTCSYYFQVEGIHVSSIHHAHNFQIQSNSKQDIYIYKIVIKKEMYVIPTERLKYDFLENITSFGIVCFSKR